MRLISMSPLILSAATFFSTALAAKTKPSTFDQLHALALSSGGSPLKLNDASFNDITALPRNYSAALLLTALDVRVGCKLCRELQPEWELLGKSWMKGDKPGDSRLLFGTLDYVDGRQTFEALRLQTAPILFLYPPTQGPDAKSDAQPLRYDFTSGAADADPIHNWLSRQLPASAPKPAIQRPVNYIRILFTVLSTAGVISAFTVAWPYVSPILQNRNLWAAFSLITILLFISGHMFNHIRGVPYISGDGKGGITYFAGGFQNQFGLESQIIAVIYAILAFATISLALKVPRIQDAKTQQYACFAWGAVLFGTYSFLLSIFRLKNSGYPLWLPPFSG